MTNTLAQHSAESYRAEREYCDAFRKKFAQDLSEDLLSCYASVLESHERRITIGMCLSPFSLSRRGRRQPGFFKCEDEFQKKLEAVLPSAAKHELHYLNASGLWSAMPSTAKEKSRLGDTATLDHARYLGLSWALKWVSGQIQLARYDHFTETVENGAVVAKSLAEAFESSTLGVYSEEFTSGLSTMQADFKRFLASETAKQQAKANVHGHPAATSESPLLFLAEGYYSKDGNDPTPVLRGCCIIC